jgi:hypothetical protein
MNNMSKSASLNYGISFPEEEMKRIVVNLFESGIGEEFIALQLDLENSNSYQHSKRV